MSGEAVLHMETQRGSTYRQLTGFACLPWGEVAAWAAAPGFML